MQVDVPGVTKLVVMTRARTFVTEVDKHGANEAVFPIALGLSRRCHRWITQQRGRSLHAQSLQVEQRRQIQTDA